MPRYLLITNPFSSRGLGERGTARVTRLFLEAGAEIDTRSTEGPGDAAEAARSAEGYDALIAAGGDGTIAEIVNGLAGRPVPIGILPCGTGNVLAKELGIPKNIPAAAAVILAGETAVLDVGLAGDRRFVLMASAGCDAQVVVAAHRGRGGWFGLWNYFAAVAAVVCAGEFPEIAVEAGGSEYLCRHVVVANVENYGGPIKPARGARYDDGLFDVVMFTRPGRYNMLRYAMISLWAKGSAAVDIVRFRAPSVRLSSRSPVELQLDGDPAGGLPVELGIRRAEAVFILPQ